MKKWISRVTGKAAGTSPRGLRAAAKAAASAALLVAAALAAVSSGHPQAARAAVGDLVCTGGTYSVTFSPGLRNTPRSFKFTGSGTLTGCVSLSDLTISPLATQSFTFSGSGTGGCTGVSASLTATATWNNGRTSTGSGAFTITIVNGIPSGSGSGHVTSGEFTGDSATALAGFGLNPVACATPAGQTSGTGGVLALTLA
jgi:hypothetical protein